MAGVQHIRGKTHVNAAVFNLLQPGGNHSQVFRGIHLRAQGTRHVQWLDPTDIGNCIKGVFCIAFPLALFAEGFNLPEPDKPISLIQLIQRLSCHGIFKKSNSDLFDPPVPDHCLKILFRQRNRGRYRHTGILRSQRLIQHRIFKNQVAMH